MVVNGREAKPLAANYAEWETQLDVGEPTITARAEDAAGNVEPRPHVVRVGERLQHALTAYLASLN